MEAIEAFQIKKAVDERVLRKSNVVATGIGYKNGDPEQGIALITSVTKKKPPGLRKNHVSQIQRVSKSYDGLQTDVNETGHIVAFANPQDRFRPQIPGGVSVGHYKITAGTLGMWVNYLDKKVMLSNNHVLANSNDAKVGDPILQPGAHDGGKHPDDYIADLTKFIPINFEGSESDCDAINMIARTTNWFSRKLGRNSELRTYVTDRKAADNLVDCAIATPLSQDFVEQKMYDGFEVQGWTDLILGDGVHKFGRTTGHTVGIIEQIGVTAMVGYGPGKLAKFVNQLMAGAMSEGGDSGSVVLKGNQVGGLLFAGSTNTTIINPIAEVLHALQISI